MHPQILKQAFSNAKKSFSSKKFEPLLYRFSQHALDVVRKDNKKFVCGMIFTSTFLSIYGTAVEAVAVKDVIQDVEHR